MTSPHVSSCHHLRHPTASLTSSPTKPCKLASCRHLFQPHIRRRLAVRHSLGAEQVLLGEFERLGSPSVVVLWLDAVVAALAPPPLLRLAECRTQCAQGVEVRGDVRALLLPCFTRANAERSLPSRYLPARRTFSSLHPHPKPSTLNPQPSTLNPQPYTQNPKSDGA